MNGLICCCNATRKPKKPSKMAAASLADLDKKRSCSKTLVKDDDCGKDASFDCKRHQCFALKVEKDRLVAAIHNCSMPQAPNSICSTIALEQWELIDVHYYISIKNCPRHRNHQAKRRFSADNVSQDMLITPSTDLCALMSTEILLKQSSKWKFNIFLLEHFTVNRSLFYIGWHLFNYHNLIQEFHLDPVKLCRTLNLIEKCYHSSNPYHNALHAADVAQAMHCFVQENKLSLCLSKLDVMACIMAALCHDLDHPGKNANYIIASHHIFADLYAKQDSILEKHHWYATRSLLHETELFSHSFMAQHVDKLFDMMKEMILATDMGQHVSFMKLLENHPRKISSSTVENMPNSLHLNVTSSEYEKYLALRLTLKCADICNPARSWLQCSAWAELIVAEFFAQGDAERVAGRKCSLLMNRHVDEIANIQLGFIKFVVQPLFDLWHSWHESSLSHCLVTHIQKNLQLWQISHNASKAE